MTEVMCQHCKKYVRLSRARDHWRECPNSPARKVVEAQNALISDLLEACEAIVREGDPETATRDWSTAEDFAGFCLEQAQAAIAKAERDL